MTTIFIFLLIGLMYFGLSAFVSYPPEEIPVQTSSSSSVAASIDFSKPTPPPLNRRAAMAGLKQTAWIPDWDFNKGFSSFANNPQAFHSVSPVWYSLNDDGGTVAKRVGYDRIRPLSKQYGIKLIPSVANFDADQFKKILSDKSKLDAHIQFLISEVETYDFDGLDLDYESMYYEDQPAFLYMLQKLYDYMEGHNKLLTIAVMPTWTRADIYRTLRQTRRAQDWHEVGKYVHELRIMTYNLTNYNSQYPGPVAPLDWMEANLRYARSAVDQDKIVLGVNHYGYDGWSNNLVIAPRYLGFLSNGSLEKGQADAVTYKQVREYDRYKVSDVLDPDSGEKIMKYRFEDKDYVIYYPDRASTALRFDLAKRYGIAGIAYWRMGDEDTSVYTLR